jgi:Ca2+-binding RTX toxin-like protein
VSIAGKIAFGTNVAGGNTDVITGFENASGGGGNDRIFGSALANIINGGGGADVLSGFGGNDIITGGLGNDNMEGGTGNDRLEGGDGDDFIVGDTFVQSGFLSTGVGADALLGGVGEDTLFGGAGRDVLTGGTESDTFFFRSKTESGVSATTRDTITDFEGSGGAGGDVIALNLIDADERSFPFSAGDQAFQFTSHDGLGAFSVGAAGFLRFEYTAAGTVIYGETNGDGKADFSILVVGQHRFSASPAEDFFL